MIAVSYVLPFAGMPTADVLAFARAVHDRPAARLWQGQAASADPTHAFVAAAGAGIGVPAGIGVTLTPLRHPFDAAVQARSLAEVTGMPVVAGFGPGSRAFQAALLGAPYPRPLDVMREYLGVVRELVAGRAVSVRGAELHCEGALTGPPSHPVEVGAGVLRPGMARVAGECADVAITWMTPAGYLAGPIAQALAEGAAGAGRATPRVAAMIGVAVEGPDADLAQLVMAAHGRHLRGPHYRSMLEQAGVRLPRSGFRDMAVALAEGGGFLHGDPDTVAAGLAGFEAAGVDEVVLNLAASCALRGVPAALAEAQAIHHAYLARERRPAAVPADSRSTTGVLHAAAH
ncbi:LLM class flavin-dependent oxidoreductase [uncultured Cellulomonas sp.]|uniref:LLM class flavin-dependent oxidoreductase n=1 Tax=uncultured Cellulomonas sp. TaxID=189682 RepID=UPI00260D9847|nr:LLM class flavin-dependent oxidoreductase [uncultured Cellulomonas sp.]